MTMIPGPHNLMSATAPREAKPTDQGDPEDDSGPEPEPRDTGIRVELNLQAQEPDPPISGWFEHHLAQIASLAGVSNGWVSVAIVDDARMAQIHQRYAGVAGTTDVLTFDLRDHPQADLEGDLVICLDEAARQAADKGHAVRLEALLYAVHGLLHLIGYDDGDPQEAQAMHQKEDQLLVAAGLGPVYWNQPDDAAL